MAEEVKSTPKTDVHDMKAVSSFLKNNHGKIVMGAVGVGIVKAMLDDEDDDLLSTAGTGIKAGLAGAALNYGAQSLFKTDTIQDLVRGEVNAVSKIKRDSVNAEQRVKRLAAKLPIAGKIGMGVIGAATLLDLGMRLGDHVGAKANELGQELEIKKRQKQKKKKQKQYSYSHINDGDIVLGLFDQRTGHYKMGNAKMGFAVNQEYN